MNKLNFIWRITIILVFGTNISFSQQQEIKGRITVFDSIPVNKAEIRIKSSGAIFKSNDDGTFRIICALKDKLIIKAHGFQHERIKVDQLNDSLKIDLIIKSDPESREIAFGYGHVKERDKLFASSSLHDENDDFSIYSTMLELIEGRFPGVDTQNEKVIIRGMNSPVGDNTPLIMVDGAKVDYDYFLMIPPVEVQSIDIIKDGNTAIYGLEGGSGVIVIELKKQLIREYK